MRAIGLGHRTRGRTGLHPTTMANVSIRGIGRETAAVLSMITTGIMIETATSTIMSDMMTDMVIMTTAGTTDSPHRPEPLGSFGDGAVSFFVMTPDQGEVSGAHSLGDSPAKHQLTAHRSRAQVGGAVAPAPQPPATCTAREKTNPPQLHRPMR
jgi:hypothetical protein